MKFKQRLRRLDLKDCLLIEFSFFILGIIICSFYSNLSNFFKQNLILIVFLLVIILIRPLIKIFRN
jgi:hypothetical protein